MLRTEMIVLINNMCLLLVVCPTQSDMVWCDGRAMDGAEAEHSPSDDEDW